MFKITSDEDKSLHTFGIAECVNRIMKEQAIKRRTRKQAQQIEQEEELLDKEKRTKKRHEELVVSTLSRPLPTTEKLKTTPSRKSPRKLVE